MDRNALIAKIEGLRPALEAEGVEHIALFGSRARGDALPESDVDILLDIAPERKLSLLDLIGIEHLVTDSTGVQANAFTRRGLDPAFSRTIAPDLVVVF